MSRRLFALAALFLFAAAPGPCGGVEDDLGDQPDAGIVGTGPVTALFQVPRSGVSSEFYSLPFPNDLRLRADGTVNLDDHPRGDALVDLWFDIFTVKTHGFGINQASFVRFSGPIDSATLPQSPADSTAAAASVYLVDVDPASPDMGRKAPVRFRFQVAENLTIGPNWLGSLPYPGFPLREKTTYALVITRRLTAGGEAVRRSADFEALMGTGGDAQVTHAREVYQPLLDWLDGSSSSDNRADVVAASVFTTQDATGLMGKIREVIVRPCDGAVFPACVPEPDATSVNKVTPGSNYVVFEGRYSSPNFQSGEPPYLQSGGEIVVDGSGTPVPQRMENLRFAVTFPNGAMPEGGWPVVLYSHGTGGSYRSYINDGTARRMAAEGLAVISHDQVLHGPRDPTGNDPEITFFNFFNPVAGRDNVRQGALDEFQMVRLAKRLRVVDGQTTHKMDPARMYFMGHSQGGLTGPPFLAHEPEIEGAVLSGAAGLIYYALLYKTEPVDVAALVKSRIKDDPLDEFNNVLAIVQMFIDPADPVSYGPLLVRQPLDSVGPKHIFQSEGFIDHYAQNVGIRALGVSIGLAPVMPVIQPVDGFTLRGLSTLQAPVSGNLGGKTGVFLQYTAPTGEDGHFVVFDVTAAQRQHAKFLGTLAQMGVATLVP